MARIDFSVYDKEELIELLTINHLKMEQKKQLLRKTRKRLLTAKMKIEKMKTIIARQRESNLQRIRTFHGSTLENSHA